MSQPIDTASVAIVPDLSRFPRELRAGVDAALRSLVQDVDRAFATVERAAGEAGRDVGREMQAGGEVAERALREVSTVATREMAQVSASASAAGSTLGSRLKSGAAIATVALLAIGAAAAAGLGAMTFFGLKSAAALEQTVVGLQALTGSAQVAQSFLEELQQFAATTPFEFQGVADAARRILAFGSAIGITREEVIPTLTVIGDLVSVLGGTQEAIDSVVRALGQISSKGKVSQEELLQLAEALPGFNANAAIAAATGLSVADTLELITAGGVDATTGINALLAGMAQFPGAAGAMALQAQTLLGVFSTFKDTLSIALTNAFQPVIPEIKAALADLTPVLGDAVGDLAPALGRLLSSVLPLVGQLVKAIVPILTPILDALGPALEQLGPALEPLGMAIGEVLVALGPSLPLLAQFIVAIAQLAVPVLLLLAQVLKPLTPILNFMTSAIAEFNKALSAINWGEVGQDIASFATSAWNAVWAFFTMTGKFLLSLPDRAREAFAAFRQAAVDRIMAVIEFVQSLPGRILAALGNLAGTLVQAGRDLVAGLWNGISAMGGWLFSKVKDFIYQNTVQAAKDALGISSPSRVMALEVGRQIPAGAAEGIEAGMPSLQSLIGSIVPGRGTQSSSSAAATTTALGAITINLNFYGTQPTEGEARAAGAAAFDGVASSAARRGIALAGRAA